MLRIGFAVVVFFAALCAWGCASKPTHAIGDASVLDSTVASTSGTGGSGAGTGGTGGAGSGGTGGRPGVDASAAGGGGTGAADGGAGTDAADAGPEEVRACGSTGACLGIFYHTWHCPSLSPSVHNLAKILANQEQPGPWSSWHWWNEPQAGFYCLSQNDALLKKHAEQLRDAGLDFVFVDVTNHPNQAGSESMIQEPYSRLLEVWKTVPGAPKIVPWVWLKTGSDMIDFLVDGLVKYPTLQFKYQGKPLILVRPQELDTAKVNSLSANYTVRQMWGLSGGNDPAEQWSFLQSCENGFRQSGGTTTCNQRVARRDNKIEQITIATAYQSTYMSETSTATPKFHGNTLRKQFETLFNNPDVPIATITGWNEWMAQRYCKDQSQSCSLQDSFFVDQYNAEYSRDIEPGGPDGDYYYRLMTSCIRIYRRGQDCNSAKNELCCQ